MLYRFFDKKPKGTGIKSMPNQQLANELQKSITTDMQLISKYNKRIRYLLCTIDLFSKYAFLLL